MLHIFPPTADKGDWSLLLSLNYTFSKHLQPTSMFLFLDIFYKSKLAAHLLQLLESTFMDVSGCAQKSITVSHPDYEILNKNSA